MHSLRDMENLYPQAQRAHVFERVGWVCMAVLLGAAVLGFVGPGLTSWQKAESPGGEISVEYHRSLQYQSPSEIKIHLKSSGDEARFWLSSDYLEHCTLETITPRPGQMLSDGSRQWFIFPARDGSVRVHIKLTPAKIGSLAGEVGTASGSVPFSHFVLP